MPEVACWFTVNQHNYPYNYSSRIAVVQEVLKLGTLHFALILWSGLTAERLQGEHH